MPKRNKVPAAESRHDDSESPERRLELALEAAEERFSVLFRESSDPVLILTTRGDILTVNHAFEQLTGLRSPTLFREVKGWKDFIHPDDLDHLKRALSEREKEDRPERNECRIRSGCGTYRWYEIGIGVLHQESGKARGLLAVARDIDHRKQTEAQLREQAQTMLQRHERAQVLVSNLKTLFSLLGELPTEPARFFQGLCDILADMYSPALVAVLAEQKDGSIEVYYAGRIAADAPPSPPVPRDELPTPCAKVIQSGMPLYTNRLDVDAPFAEDPWLQERSLKTYLGAPLRDATGQIRGTLSLFDDRSCSYDSTDVELVTVTAMHVAARLRAEEQELARNELEDHLRRAQKMEAVGMLAGGIAHDFNNILGGIMGFASYLLAKSEPGSDLHRDLGLIEQSAVRAAELTRQLLAFTRRKHFAKETISLNQVVRDVLTILRRSLGKHLTLEDLLDTSEPCVLGDAGQLNQVIMNLALNASEAVGEMEGTVTLLTRCRMLNDRETTLFPSLASAGVCICLTVEDTGKGMTQEEQEHLFDPFFTTKAKSGGSGLGLSIVYGIVTNHGGGITVDSAPGRGSRFHVFFPLHQGVPPDTSQAEPTTRQLEGTETILVVDDEPIVRQMATEVLKSYNYEVVSASSGQEAVDLFHDLKDRIDLVLLDMVMPGMDGAETFQALRKMRGDIRVLLTSGFAREGRSSRILEQGALGMVPKPYRVQTLLSAVREALEAPRPKT